MGGRSTQVPTNDRPRISVLCRHVQHRDAGDDGRRLQSIGRDEDEQLQSLQTPATRSEDFAEGEADKWVSMRLHAGKCSQLTAFIGTRGSHNLAFTKQLRVRLCHSVIARPSIQDVECVQRQHVNVPSATRFSRPPRCLCYTLRFVLARHPIVLEDQFGFRAPKPTRHDRVRLSGSPALQAFISQDVECAYVGTLCAPEATRYASFAQRACIT